MALLLHMALSMNGELRLVLTRVERIFIVKATPG